jgi:hypothetical protein
MVTVCAQPGDFEHTEIAQLAWADDRGLGVVAGGDSTAPPREPAPPPGDPGGDPGTAPPPGDPGGAPGTAPPRGDPDAHAPPRLHATPDRLDVALAGVSLHARLDDRRDWPRRRPFGALGPAQLVPGLGQYWTPHLLAARVSGEARLGDRVLDLTGARVYAEKNWGTAFAPHWWWGQASFADGAGVAFAGGRVHGVAPTAVVVWTPDELIALAPPLARTVARAQGGEWHIRARGPRHEVELRGEARSAPLLLPVPVPGERRLDVRSQHHLAGRLELTARRGNRPLIHEESRLAGLEDGRPGGSSR